MSDMKTGLSRPALALACLLHVAAGRCEPAPRTAGARADQGAMAAQLRFFAEHPDRITVANVRKAFPGHYNRIPCHGRDMYCGFENADMAAKTRLTTFYVNNDRVRVAAGGRLIVFLSDSPHCLRREALDAVLGARGEQSSVPPTPDFFTGPFVRIAQFGYGGFDTGRMSVDVTAFATEDCITMINLDARPKP